MIAHITVEFLDGQPLIKLGIFTENNRLKYNVIVYGKDRMGIPYLLKDIGITHIDFSQDMDKDWFAALSFLYNEFEAV